MAKEMNNNAKSVKENSLRTVDWKLSNNSFADKVDDGKEWDHKKRLQEEITVKLKVPVDNSENKRTDLQSPTNYESSAGTLHYVSSIKGDKDIVVDHDVWSNIHYGYVGKANKSSEFLLKIGNRGNDGFKELKNSNLSSSFMTIIGHGKKETKKDENAVKLGMELYDKYGAKGKEITPEILKQEIIINKNKLNVYVR